MNINEFFKNIYKDLFPSGAISLSTVHTQI